MRPGLAIALALALGVAAPAWAERPPQEAALKRSQGAIGSVVESGLTFTNRAGDAVTLESFRGQPLLVSLVYTGCSDVCPAIIDSLHPAIEIGQEALGADSFTSITIGFDVANDTPTRMASFARSLGADLPNWHFLSADQATVDRLSTAVGFTIEAMGGGFAHMAQISILDEDGKIYRHVYGGAFEPPAIVEPLKELVFGRQRPLATIDGLIDRVRLFCTIYNSSTGRYYFNYSLVIGMAIGIACLMVVLAWLIREFRRTPTQA